MRANATFVLLRAIFWFNALRLIPAAILWGVSRNRGIINADLTRWNSLCLHDPRPLWFAWVWLMGARAEFRSLFYYRLGGISHLVKFLCRPEPTLHIRTRDIGPGMFFQHGFATIITAQKIGADCWINQQVTIGHKGDSSPIIGDRVRVAAGAKVIGGVTIGDDVVIGANAVVVHDVPDGCTVVGIPAKVVKRYGQRVSDMRP